MQQTPEERVAALESLLPLLEAHLECHGRIVARAQWESAYEPPPPGYVPPPPEPTCDGYCPACLDHQTTRCTLREERWAVEYMGLRRAYPALYALDDLLGDLMFAHPDQAAALYWVHVQPWDVWKRPEHLDRAERGVEWLAQEWGGRGLGWVPTYVPRGAVGEPSKRDQALTLRDAGWSYRRIAKELDVDKDTVGRWVTGARRGALGASEVAEGGI